MRKNQIDAAGVDVDRGLAEETERHRRALDVPAGPPRADPRVPRRLPFFCRLPHDEVPGVFLVVLVAVDARAALDAGVVEPRQLPVFRKRRDLEVDGTVAAIGVATFLERADRLPHRLDIRRISRSRAFLDDLQPERRCVLAIGVDVAVRVLAQRHASLLRLEDRPVVDVGEVHDVPDVEASLILERAAEDVDGHEGPEIPDVPSGVGRQPARVHAHEVLSQGRKRFLAPSQSVE